jgi:predicted RNA-binding Zn-ribbon protein involved in translation (DUF1610 family)
MKFRYEIVEGRANDGNGYEVVYRVVEYEDGVCKGGLGSFFERKHAEEFIAARNYEHTPCPECGSHAVVRVSGQLPVCKSCDWTGWVRES